MERGKAMVVEAVASAAEDQNSDDPGADADNQLGPPEKAATTAGQQRWLIASL